MSGLPRQPVHAPAAECHVLVFDRFVLQPAQQLRRQAIVESGPDAVLFAGMGADRRFVIKALEHDFAIRAEETDDVVAGAIVISGHRHAVGPVRFMPVCAQPVFRCQHGVAAGRALPGLPELNWRESWQLHLFVIRKSHVHIRKGQHALQRQHHDQRRFRNFERRTIALRQPVHDHLPAIEADAAAVPGQQNQGAEPAEAATQARHNYQAGQRERRDDGPARCRRCEIQEGKAAEQDHRYGGQAGQHVDQRIQPAQECHEYQEGLRSSLSINCSMP